jgi:hypothetical protein
MTDNNDATEPESWPGLASNQWPASSGDYGAWARDPCNPALSAERLTLSQE